MALAASCTKNQDYQAESEQPLKFHVSISGQTKASATSFENGDKLGLYAFESKENLEESYAGEMHVENAILTVYDNKALTDEPIYYPNLESNADFLMYYPYQDYSFNGSFLNFYIQDQSKIENYKNADIMMAQVSNVPKSNDPLQFVFKRLMSKISISLKPGEGYASADDFRNAEVLFQDVYRTATVYFHSSSVSGGYKTDMKPYGQFVSDKNGEQASGVSIILVPQTYLKGQQLFIISLNSQVYGLTLPEDLELESGKEYHYTLTLNRTASGESISVKPEITDWTEGIKENITPEVIDPMLQPIYDIDGNKYEVVRIGEQIWMAENLRTTHFNDGREIPNITEQTDWDYTDISESPAYCYYGNDESNAEKYGALYNWFTARDENICPKGWYVPGTEDLNVLKATIGGDASKLKSKSEWNPAGTDDYGFNALPGGYRRHRVDFENKGTQAKWWTYELSDMDNAAGNYFYFMSNSSDFKTMYHLKEYGLSIRCIKGEEIVEPDENDYVENGVNYGQGTEIDGLLWAPVNCGYDKTNYQYGKLYQWGRPYGQGYENDGTNPADLNGTYVLGANLVATASSESEGAMETNKDKHFKQYYNGDWTTSRQNRAWIEEYNPCPDGWRVPTQVEMTSLTANKSEMVTDPENPDKVLGMYFSGSEPYSEGVRSVFLPAAGNRTLTNQSSNRCTKTIFYWTATFGSSQPVQHYQYNKSIYYMESGAAMAAPVRCVKTL